MKGESARPQLRDVTNIQNAAITQMLLPSPQDLAQQYAWLREERPRVGARVYLALLRAFEDELHAHVAQLALDDGSDFLLYKPADRARKILLGKDLYHFDYAGRGWHCTLSYFEFEQLERLRANRSLFLQRLKEVFRNLKERRAQLDERERQLGQQLVRLAVGKQQKVKELERAEERLAGKPQKRLFFF